jgi:hypothetical protein
MKTFISIVGLLIFKSINLNAQEKNFVFKDNEQTIKLELETNNMFLIMNQLTEIKVTVEKIDLKKSSIIGKGICLTEKQGKDFFIFSVTVNDENVFNNHYSITINYPSGKSKKLKSHKFLIPVKN